MRATTSLAAALLVGLLSCSDSPSGDEHVSDADMVIRAFQESRGEYVARGRWREIPTHSRDEGLTPEQRAEIERLESIGYAAGSQDAKGFSGVSVHDPERSHAGLNLFTSGHAAEALLIDMRGHVLHSWRYEFEDIWPDYPLAHITPGLQYWRRAHLTRSGELLAIFEGLGIIKLDKESELLWAAPNGAHHDLEVLPDGRIYVLTREARMIPHINVEHPVIEDSITLLGPGGEERRRWSLIEIFERSDIQLDWATMSEEAQDIFHTNSLEFLDGRLASVNPAFRRGNFLISLRALHLIAVVDLQRERVAWASTGEWFGQHDPTVLENGNLLLFDNHKPTRESAVLELDPADMSVVWSYRHSPEAPFFSKTCGTAQRLPGGTTLITESDSGRAFEVDPDGAVVWEYWNPYRAGPDDRYIASLFEMLRLPADFEASWARGR